jgi:hypothetical protein
MLISAAAFRKDPSSLILINSSIFPLPKNGLPDTFIQIRPSTENPDMVKWILGVF